MDIKLPDISQGRRRNNISSIRNLNYEENKNKKGSIHNLSTVNDNNNNKNNNNNNNNNRNNSNHSSTQNARHIVAQESKEPILPSIRTYHLDNVESDELLKAVLRRFSSLKQSDRHNFILEIFKDCDPADMSYIYKVDRFIRNIMYIYIKKKKKKKKKKRKIIVYIIQNIKPFLDKY